jgi:amino acid permease/DNA-binding transcriptional ArsR family regulator
MATDETNLFPDREELLAGLPARRAGTLLFLIESRTAHLADRSRRAMQRFGTAEDDSERELAFFAAFSQGREPPLVPAIQDLERYSQGWAPLVAPSAQVRAAVAHRLGRKYRFTYQDTPGIRRALALDDPVVRRAYRRLYRQPLEEIFIARVPPADRLRWARAAASKRLEHLSPFWTAYSLTLTETVGATILALPIALASIGPLGGVAVLVVLGLVNIVTIGCMAEAVTRSGAIRHGGAYLGGLVGDYLGATGSLVLSVSFFLLCVLVLPVYYIGVSTTLEDATSIWAPAWVAVLFAAGLYYLRRRSLNATVASALMVGAVNIVLLVVLAILVAAHLRMGNLLHVNVPFVSGRPFRPAVLQLVFGVVLSAYLGHSSVSLCGRLVLQRDPGGRSLMRGCTAAQATAMLLYCLFVIAVNGSVAPGILAADRGTALAPITAEVGPIATVFGSLFVVLGMGMATIHFSLALSNLIREWLPAQAAPTVVLPRQGARLLFEERRRRRSGDGLRLGVTYLGFRGGDPVFGLDVSLGGDVHRLETSAAGSWEILGPAGPPAILDRMPGLRQRRLSLVLDIIDASPQSVRLKSTSSLRTTVEGAWDTSGFSLAGILALADPDAELAGWIMRQGGVTASEAARHVGEDEPAVTVRLKALAEQGLVQEAEAGSRFTARLAPRRRRALPEDIWSALGQEPKPRHPTGAARRRPPRRQAVRGALLGRRGRFMLGAAPVFACFAVTEWLLLTGSGSFAGLIGFIGVIVGSLLAGIFPALLLVASRRKGEHMPRPVHRLLGHPVLLGGLYLLFLGNVLMHGLVIWKEPWLRAGAVLVAAGIVSMTARMIRNGTFGRRLNIEVRGDQAEGRTFFAVTADGQESASNITLTYRDSERHLQASAGEIPAFSSLRHAVFEPGPASTPRQIPRQLKVRVHEATSDGDSEPIGGSITVRTGGATRRYDIKLAKGQVTLPLTGATCRVDIEPTEIPDRNAQDHDT